MKGCGPMEPDADDKKKKSAKKVSKGKSVSKPAFMTGGRY